MKDKQLFLDKSNALLKIIDEGGELNKATFYEVELLFFGFNENYPTLYELKAMKEASAKKGMRGNLHEQSKPLKQHLLRFIDFINEFR